MKLSSKPKSLRTIRSFVRRSGRRTSAQKKAWDNHWAVYGVNPEIGPVDLSTLFENKNQKFVLEIGFGNGENLIDCAKNDPYSNFSGIEVYPVGIGQCLINANKYSLKNLRLFCADAVDVLNKQIINIGPDEEFVTINKISEICSNITGSNLKPIYKKDRPQEVKHATCSADKARKLLNYKTKTDLYSGILKTFKYIKKRGTKPFNYYINLEIENELTPEYWLKKEI